MKPGGGIVSRRIPVGGASYSDKSWFPRCGLIAFNSSGQPSRPMPLAQVAFNEGLLTALHQSSGQNIKESAAIGLQQQLALPACKARIDQDQRFGGVPIVQIVRSELKMPAQFSRLSVERHHAIGVEIVAAALVAVGVREGIAGGPVQQSRFGIVGASQPGCRASGLRAPSLPGLNPRLAGFWQRPKRHSTAKSA